jgi:hypothetical protein
MADNPRRPARLGAALAVVAALTAPPLHNAVAAAPETKPDRVAEWAADGDDRFLYWAQRAAPRALVDALHLGLPNDRMIVNLPWGDMTGDRLDDVMAVELDFGIGGLGLAESRTWLEALDGRSGKSLWRRELESQLTFPVEMKLGRKARTGVLVPSYDYESETTTFLAIDHRGRTFYEQSFVATTQLDAGVVTGREDVVSFAVQNSLRGRATDVLIGISDIRKVPETDPALPSVVGRSRTAVIDGRTGEVVAHPDVEVGPRPTSTATASRTT